MGQATIDRPVAEPRQDELAFTPSLTPTLGVELELQILDRESGDLAPGSPRILKACAEEKLTGVTAELMQSMIEVRTGVCPSVQAAQAELLPLISKVRNVATSLGYQLGLGGTHPFHKSSTSAVFPAERYEKIHDRLAWLTYQRVVFGLHVHVGMPSGERALGVISMMLQYLPHLVALSANSPFWHGVDTGLASGRVALYGLLPQAGVPPYFAKWKDFRSYCQVMKACQAIHSFKDIYWDIRPRPDFGTIEIRICDTPASLAVLFGLVTLIRSLVIASLRLLEERPRLRRGDLRRHWIAVENKWLATRYGLDANYIRTPAGKRRPLRQDVADLVERLRPIAQEAGDDGYLSVFRAMDQFETGADRARRLYRQTGNWKTLTDDTTQRLAKELEAAVPATPSSPSEVLD